MPYYKFKKNDLFYNVVKTHPSNEFYVVDGKVFHNLQPQISGSFTASVPGVPPGNISLYELNVDRNKEDHLFVPDTLENNDLGTVNTSGVKSVIFPFVEKNSDQNIKLKHITDTEYNTHYDWGQKITGSYPLSASVKRKFYASQESGIKDAGNDSLGFSEPEAMNKPGVNPDGDEITRGVDNTVTYTRRHNIQALRNTLDYYKPMSHHFAFSSSIENWRKDLQELNLISIPSIYYGQSIKRGSVDLKFFVNGQRVGRLRDLKKNGELLDMSMEPFAKKSIFFDGYNVLLPEAPNETEVVTNTLPPPAPPAVTTIDGISDRILIPQNTAMNTINTFSISLWFHRVGFANPHLPDVLFSLGQRHHLYLHHDRICFRVDFDESPSGGLWTTASNVVKFGQWHHVVLTYNGSSVDNNPIIYLDNSALTVGDGLTEFATPEGTFVLAGTSPHGGLEHNSIGSTLMPTKIENATSPTYELLPFEGHIDEVSFWNAALSSDHVGEIWNSGEVCNLVDHTQYNTSLVSWWRMGEITNTDNDSLEKNSPSGPYPSLVDDEYSTNYIIPDEKGSDCDDAPDSLVCSDGYMQGFQDIPADAIWADNLKYLKSGITGVTPDSCLTSSHKDVEGNNLVAGVVLYNEGFLILTGTWNLGTDVQSDYKDDGSANDYPRWTYFGSRMTSGSGDADSDRSHDLSMESKDNLKDGTHSLENAVFYLAFSGTNYVPTRTMLAQAPKGRLNHSNNPTYVKFNSVVFDSTGSSGYLEGSKTPIKNIVSSSHKHYSASFAKQTYISKIGIYDENKNLIAISKLATPIRKRELDNLTFKLKLDF